MALDYYKLDNPAWYALSETHSGFAITHGNVKRYQPDIVAFAAHADTDPSTLSLLDHIISPNEYFFLIGDEAQLPKNYSEIFTLPCLQMVCTQPINMDITASIYQLEEKDDDDILSLINLVQPGYFNRGTRLMGDYYGIRENDQLVAMAGERMRLNGFTEVSAVVTHPDFTGRKYAQQLMTKVVNKIFAEGIIPILHVSKANERAIALYEYLGFETRRVINFTKFRRNN